MRGTDLVAISVFMFFFILVSVFNLTVLFRILFKRRNHGDRPSGYSRGIIVLFMILMPLEVICLIDGFFIEPNLPEITRHSMETGLIPEGKRLRFVHISDLHIEEFGSREKKLLKIVAESNPDLILCTGDLMNYAEDLPSVQLVLDGLEKTAPLFLVSGNVDCGFMRKIEELKRDYTFLDSGTVTWEAEGFSVDLTGADECLPMIIRSAARKLEGSDRFSILMYHRPSLAKEEYLGVFDLYLCGHTHGGQIRLPLYGAVITLAEYGKEFEAGMYTEGHTQIYVNRGYGFEGGNWWIPKVRFMCRPEIAVFEITGTGTDIGN